MSDRVKQDAPPARRRLELRLPRPDCDRSSDVCIQIPGSEIEVHLLSMWPIRPARHHIVLRPHQRDQRPRA